MSAVIRAYWTVDNFDRLWTKRRINGVWEAPRQLFYDDAVNPPAGGGSPDSFLNGISAGAMIPSLAGLQGVMLSTQPNSFVTTSYYYLASALGTPEVIDATNFPDELDFFGLSQGVWKYNGALWMIGFVSPSSSSMRVYRRDLSGGPWVPQDTANEPTSTRGSSDLWAVRWNGLSSKITVVVSDDQLTYQIKEFDMSVPGWLAYRDPITYPFNARVNAGIGLCVTDAGDIGLLVATGASDNFETSIYLSTLFSGTWTTTLLADTVNGRTPRNFSAKPEVILADPNGTRFHCFFSMVDTAAGVSKSYYFYQAVDGGVLGAFNAFPYNRGISDGMSGLMVSSEDYGIVSHDDFQPSSPFLGTAKAWRFGPLSAPVFTEETIEGAHPEEFVTCTFLTFELGESPGRRRMTIPQVITPHF